MTIQLTDEQACEKIREIGRKMQENQYVFATDGNISIRSAENRIWITASGTPKGEITPENLVCIDLLGNILQGHGHPSSETPMHLMVYQQNPDVTSVVHAHPICATTMAILQTPLDLALMPEFVIGLGVVPLVPYATTRTLQMAEAVAPYCSEYHAALLQNHGAITWGKDINEAYYRLESLEYCASVMLQLQKIGPIPPQALLTRTQVYDLLQLREKSGRTTGGIPRCREDFTQA